MIAGILKEKGNESRVALLPGEAGVLKKLGADVIIESGAGAKASSSDENYVAAGVSPANRKDVISKSDIILCVNPPLDEPFDQFREGQVIVCVLNPSENKEWLEKARLRGLTVLALDLIPRITRAQSMDILSSMATVAGYKAVLDAATLLPRFFPMFMSASGTIKPAKVLVLGAGVAGLQAIAISRKLGAVVDVFDVRSAVKEEVKSLGGKFIEVEGAVEDASAGGYAVEQTEEFRKKQQAVIQERAKASDVIICTAQIPGRKAPVLVQADTVRAMKPGSVIVDLAASTGGNCEVTQNGKNIFFCGINVVGRTDYPSVMATDASRMFGSNLVNLLKIMVDKNGTLLIDLKDDIVNGTTAVHGKEYVSARAKQILNIV
jgi:H+-translocating NAD(P) transhydrogenase subunit alpha